MKKRNIAFVLLMVFLTIICAYVAFRLLKQNHPRSVGTSERSIRLREWRPDLKQEFTPQTEQLEHSDALVQQAYTVSTDHEGFIQPVQMYQNPDLNLVFLGGSTTECLYVDDSLRFPYLTGKMISSLTGQQVNSYNAAMSGNNSMHSINLLLNKIIPMQPDMVLMMHNVNDWNVLLKERSYWNNNPSKSLIIDPRWKDEQIKDEWQDTRGKKLQIDISAFLAEFYQAQHLFIDICQRFDIEPVLMTQASRFTDSIDTSIHHGLIDHSKKLGFSYMEAKVLQDTFNVAIRAIAAQRNVLLIDLEAEFPKTKAYMYDIIHFHNQGSQFVSKLIAAQLIHHLQLEQKARAK